MLSMGYFLQGHIDRDETTMIASHEVYQQYTQAELARIQREEEEKTPKSEVDQLVAEGQRYIAHIHECNDAIPGEEISAKLQRLEDIMTRIFEQLRHSPESAGDLRKLMNYYLPTTTKLIDTYRELDAKPEVGDNIKKTKKEIEKQVTLEEYYKAICELDELEEKYWPLPIENMFMVGDEDQSIYGFRECEPELFDAIITCLPLVI